MKNRKNDMVYIVNCKSLYIGKNGEKSHVEKVVYRLSRLCHISADGTVNVTQNGTINIIINSGGNGGNPNAIIFLILEGGGAA